MVLGALEYPVVFLLTIPLTRRYYFSIHGYSLDVFFFHSLMVLRCSSNCKREQAKVQTFTVPFSKNRGAYTTIPLELSSRDGSIFSLPCIPVHIHKRTTHTRVICTYRVKMRSRSEHLNSELLTFVWTMFAIVRLTWGRILIRFPLRLNARSFVTTDHFVNR